MKISIVITVFNEQDNVEHLIGNIEAALSDWEYEVIFVDDGSTDNTRSNIKKFANGRVKLVTLYKNYGQTTAMAAGIEEAKNPYIITMDGDLQNDPEDIPAMVNKLVEEDWDVVAGIRSKRKDGFLLRKIPSRIANILIRRMTGVLLQDYGCTLKVFKKEIADDLGLYGELHRFIPVLAHIQGARITEMKVKHHPRLHGESKYGLGRTFKVVSDLILVVFFQKYLHKPMHIFGTAGVITFLIGAVINSYLIVLKLLGEDIWGRPILILGITLLLGGVQLITFGLMAEMLTRTYYESGNKKTYRIREVYDGSNSDD